jgi:hypothetical protein
MSDDDKSKLIDKYRKVRTLAERGIGGEAENAKKIADEMLSKNAGYIERSIADEVARDDQAIKRWAMARRRGVR